VLNVCYINQSVNAVYGNNLSLFSGSQKTHTYNVVQEPRKVVC